MSNEIQAVVQQNEVTQQLLMDYLMQTNSNLQPNEQAQFVAIASAFGLNPWKREIYAVAYGEGTKRKLSIIVGYETYLRRAESFPQYDGYDTEFGVDNKIITCTCRVYRKDRSRPTCSTVYLNEYHQGNTMWNTKPRVMLEKVAICTAMRRAFPDEMGGMPYAEDEMPTSEKLQQQGLQEVRTEAVKEEPNAAPTPKAKKPLTEEEKRDNFMKMMSALCDRNPDLYATYFKFLGYETEADVAPADRQTVYTAIKELLDEEEKHAAESQEVENG